MEKRKVYIILLAIIGICLITSGVSYAFLSYQKEGTKSVTMTSGSIMLHYQEDSLKKINKTEVLPMSDANGKAQTEYFEFTITGQSATYDIPYIISSRVLTTSENRIPYNYISIYVTEVVNNSEVMVLDTTYDKLDMIYKNNNIEQKLFSSSIPQETTNFSKTYRLRVWINEDAIFTPKEVTLYYCDGVEVTEEGYNLCSNNPTTGTDYIYPLNNKTFEFKINVYTDAEGLPAGLYDNEYNIVKTWDELESLGLTKESIEYNYSYNNYKTIEGSPYKIFNANNLSGNLILPEGITKIGTYSFKECPGLTGITLSDTVTTISGGAFMDSNIVEINFKEGLNTIEGWAFENSKNIKSLYIPASVTSIENAAFAGCSGVESVIVDSANKKYDSRDNCNAIIIKSSNQMISGFKTTTIPSTVTTIASFSFYEIDTLTSITIPDTVRSIHSAVFGKCTSLSSITLPSTLKAISDRIFEYCSSLTSINIPSTVTIIGQQAFRDTGLLSIDIPSGVKTIDETSFYNCQNLASVTIPNTVTTINSDAFNSTAITSLYIPSSVTTMSSSAFNRTGSLQTIVVDPENTVYDSRDNSNAIIKTSTNALWQGCMNTTIPNTVETLISYSFSYLPGLTDVYIPASVKMINTSTFEHSNNLRTVTFEDTENWIKANYSTATSGYNLDLSNPIDNASSFKSSWFNLSYLINTSE